MTALLEHPMPDLPALPDLPDLPDLGWALHLHTDRCWWHPEAASWVCPPGSTT